MLKNFDDVDVDFYLCDKKVDRRSKTYKDALAVINEVAAKMWDVEEYQEKWVEELEINYCGSLIDIIDCHVFVYLCNRLARKRCLGFVFWDTSIAVVEGGVNRQDHWMIDLRC